MQLHYLAVNLALPALCQSCFSTAAVGQTDGQMDGWMPSSCIDPAPHTVLAVQVTKQQTVPQIVVDVTSEKFLVYFLDS